MYHTDRRLLFVIAASLVACLLTNVRETILLLDKSIPTEAPTVNHTRATPFVNTTLCENVQVAIIGFAKCGTTAMADWLGQHPDIFIPKNEIIDLRFSSKLLHKRLGKLKGNFEGTLVGYKNPHDVQYENAIEFYRSNCPNTKLIVLVRHPVDWLESFFNYRVKKRERWAILSPNPNDLVLWDKQNPAKPTSGTGSFHKYLKRLGKDGKDPALKVSNPIYLLDMSQLKDNSNNNTHALARDLQDFLELDTPLALPIPHTNSIQTLSKKPSNYSLMDICHAENTKIHNAMMEVSSNASQWMLESFLPFVRHWKMDEILHQKWQRDPCEKRRVG